MIDSRQLRIFVTLARKLNMGRAAEELGLTKSALSHALKTLETETACQLFERSSRGFILTQAGARLLAEAEPILRQLQTLQDNLLSTQKRRTGRLRLGGSATACLHLIPPVLREFRESFPDYRIEITLVNSSSAEEMLADDRLDLAVVLEPQASSRAHFIPVAEDRLAFLLNPLHPWALREKVDRSELAEQKIILPLRRSETYRMIEAYFRREGTTVRPFIEVDSEETIKRFVQLDLGIGICPLWMARQELQQGLMRSMPLGRRKLTRRWVVMSPPKRKFDFAENLFIGICHSIAPNVMKLA